MTFPFFRQNDCLNTRSCELGNHVPKSPPSRLTFVKRQWERDLGGTYPAESGSRRVTFCTRQYEGRGLSSATHRLPVIRLPLDNSLIAHFAWCRFLTQDRASYGHASLRWISHARYMSKGLV